MWKAPKLSASAVAAFLLGVTPLMHDFWAVEEEERDGELTSFLKILHSLAQHSHSSAVRED